MNCKAILFVSNISSIANSQYLERLFSAYGAVHHVQLFGEGPQLYAEVTYGTVDDADAAVAALHCHYQTCRNLPMIVLYSKNSPAVSAYGHQVGEEFMKAAEEKRPPRPLALDKFDSNYQRLGVQPPPLESDIIRERPPPELPMKRRRRGGREGESQPKRNPRRVPTYSRSSPVSLVIPYPFHLNSICISK
ncbi:hypothetical protein JKF63_03109 [Porcisia hertigi]|uniref:RRM domain-containing protein n=1 Tax=Porcisia hertigi TaxID=2761500 RepID=A0A836IMS7_9TRYP|nr:hypothetical protein JKF63_03109 [Porcisia hertigi]